VTEGLALSRSRAALLVIDIQERLAAAMPEAVLAQVLRNTAILIDAAQQLGLPIAVSQQYPKGLGPTVQALESVIPASAHRFDKLEFSAAHGYDKGKSPPGLARDQWILCGMETHVCVYQTARALVDRGLFVHVAIDAACSRTKSNFKIGKKLMERAGAVITSTETVVFDLLGRAGTDDFKALSRAIK
jgi:nicotinamidase-related amidase